MKEINNKILHRYTFELSPLSIIILDNEGYVKLINPAGLKMLGYKKDEIIGKNFSNIYSSENTADYLKTYNKLIRNKNNKSLKIQFLKKDGSSLYCDTISIPLKINKKIIGLQLITSDISKNIEINTKFKDKIQYHNKPCNVDILRDVKGFKKVDRKLEEYYKELEIRDENLKMMNSELNVVREQLTILNKVLEDKVKERTDEINKLLNQKERFIVELGHDLRTPLTALINLPSILKKEEIDQDKIKILDIIIGNVEYLKNTIFKTIKLTELNAPSFKLNLLNIDLSKEFDSFISYLNQTISKEIEIENNVKENTNVSYDKDLLHILLDNLFDNAIKYNNDKVKIKIDTESNENYITVSIKDNGIGLAPEHIQHIFEEFYKADDSRHDLKSTGLGLAICRTIVEKHGGKMWVESPGIKKGSTFSFNIPRVKNQELENIIVSMNN